MPSISIAKTFCTTREAARLLGVATSTVQVWVETGLLRAWKTSGGHRRVLRESVDALVHSRGEPEQSTTPAPGNLEVVPRPLKLMVVEDEAFLLRLYRAKISAWPFSTELVTFDNAVTALVAMGRLAPDLLVTDLHMPGMDGFNMLRVLRQIPETARTTIVVVSGLDAVQIEERGGVPAGIQVFPKPIPFDRLQGIAASLNGARTGVAAGAVA